MGVTKMNAASKVALAVLAASYLISGVALVLGAFSVGKAAVLPALVLSGWAFLGHFVTLDDDMPGEWSNPEGSRKLWLTSVAELFVKLAAFGGALWLFFAQAKA